MSQPAALVAASPFLSSSALLTSDFGLPSPDPFSTNIAISGHRNSHIRHAMHFSGCATVILNRSSRSSVPVEQNSTYIRQPLQSCRMIVCRCPLGPIDEIGSCFRNFFTRHLAAGSTQATDCGFPLASEWLLYRGESAGQPREN
jgi:hypothetical protein